MKKRKKGRRFTLSAVRQAPRHRTIEVEPEELAVYVRRAEKEVLPIIKETQISPDAAQFLLAQQTQVLVTGDPRLTTESGMAIANRVLDLWQEGYSMPGPAYPYTLEETLRGLEEGPKAKGHYEVCFQPFTPANGETPCGFGEVTGGIVKHPETTLWQMEMIADGPYTFLADYRDPVKAQTTLKQSSARAGREGPMQRLQPFILGRFNRRQTGNRSSFSTK
jgi:hypothetical protein